jgi:hypothetical protein
MIKASLGGTIGATAAGLLAWHLECPPAEAFFMGVCFVGVGVLGSLALFK